MQGCNTDLSELIDSGRAFLREAVPELRALVRPRAAHLRAWLDSGTAAGEMVPHARACLEALDGEEAARVLGAN